MKKRDLWDLLGQAKEVEPSVGFRSRLWEKIENISGSTFLGRIFDRIPIPRWVVLTGAAGLFFMLGWAVPRAAQSQEWWMRGPVETSLRQEMDELRVQLTHEQIALCAVLKDSAPDDNRVAQALERITALEMSQQQLAVKHLSSMRAALTAEQKDRFFTGLMRDLCMGCRHSSCSPGVPCMCGQCEGHGPVKS